MMLIALILIGVVVVLVILFAYLYRAPDLSQFDTPRAALLLEEHEISGAHDNVVAMINDFIAAADPKLNIHDQRLNMENLMGSEISAAITPVDVDGIPGEWVVAKGADANKRLLYLHGGGFRFGSPKSHRYIPGELSRLAGVSVLAVDYRMMPEYKITACHEDARKAYQWILNNGPKGAEGLQALYVAGDSAGGNLTLSVIAWARDAGIRAANASVVFAPLTDFTMTNPTWRTNLATDPFLGPFIQPMSKLPRWVLAFATRLPTGRPVNHPEISPLFGNLANLPPTLIQVSRDEVLYDDAQRYANRAVHSGSKVQLDVWPKLVHVFQAFEAIPESGLALQRAADFIGTN
jgi:monoterpene epsilon-lactone hydrolase